eukprot:TRINITY_DN1022_c0_g1_i3.p1 TRINITY_DN1022_c0_g1~~TRINITY_DN1022_c0_g1_i3.p1  ORF type:complete len:214 (+),score=31.57 TRINITY_DN1022_c0_g1_i3:97-738(+)
MGDRSMPLWFCDINGGNIDELRKMNSAIFPVRYSNQFYEDVLALPRELAQFACLGGAVIGAICCRVEPFMPGQFLSSNANSANGVQVVSLVPGISYSQAELGAGGVLAGGFSANNNSSTAEVDPVRQRLYIVTLGVMAAHRGRGVGRRLLDLMLANLQHLPDVCEVYLHVQTSNAGAIAFYERAGFHKEAIIKNYYRHIEPPDCYLLLKAVNS